MDILVHKIMLVIGLYYNHYIISNFIHKIKILFCVVNNKVFALFKYDISIQLQKKNVCNKVVFREKQFLLIFFTWRENNNNKIGENVFQDKKLFSYYSFCRMMFPTL